jgi:hypothetical protein
LLIHHAPWATMTAPLFTPERAEAAAVRHWGRHEAQRLAVCVTRGIYPEDEAQRELATHLAWHAQRAKIHSFSCQALAADMLADEVAIIEERHYAVRSRMIDAAEAVLRANPLDRLAAAYAAADIARVEQVPVDLVDAAFNIALWRIKRRA